MFVLLVLTTIQLINNSPECWWLHTKCTWYKHSCQNPKQGQGQGSVHSPHSGCYIEMIDSCINTFSNVIFIVIFIVIYTIKNRNIFTYCEIFNLLFFLSRHIHALTTLYTLTLLWCPKAWLFCDQVWYNCYASVAFCLHFTPRSLVCQRSTTSRLTQAGCPRGFWVLNVWGTWGGSWKW